MSLVARGLLMHMFQFSFDNSDFPDLWSVACITPLPKQGDSTLVSNLKPISILPLIGKLQEKLARNYFMNYLEENNILNNC